MTADVLSVELAFAIWVGGLALGAALTVIREGVDAWSRRHDKGNR